MPQQPLRFELLSRQHNRAAFSCGEPPLDEYLKQHARANARLGIAAVHILHDTEANRIAGYFSLSAAALHVEDLPPDLARKLPRYPVPIMLVARLAVDREYQGRGLGGDLLVHALATILDLSERGGIYAAVVDAKNDSARAFYEHYGFTRLPGRPYTLFLRTIAIRELFT